MTIRRIPFIPGAIMKRVGQDGHEYMIPYFPNLQDSVSGSRQDSEGYEIDHTFECFTYNSWLNREKGINPWNYLGVKIKGIEQHFHNHNCFVDVHTIDDIHWLKFIVKYLGYKGMERRNK